MPLSESKQTGLPSTKARPRPGAAARAARDATAAVVVTLAALSFYVSAATLLFQGRLGASLPFAIGAMLLGAGLLAAFAAWRGTLPLASCGPDSSTIPVFAAITAGIAATAPAQALLPTALAALGLTGAAIGGLWWIIGHRGWGDLIRYIPYPVIGGFLASTGWMMLTGGLGVSVGSSVDVAHPLAWWQGAADLRLATAVVLGIVIWGATARLRHPLVLPGVLALGAAAIHAGLAAAGSDLAAARAEGWLLAPFDRTLPVWPWSLGDVGTVDWNAIAQQAPLIASAVIVATISLLLSDSSLEVEWDQDSDFNRDLRVYGQGNLLATALGGIVGGISISRSLLNRRAGAVSRASGHGKALLCLLAMLYGEPVLALVPRPLLGAMLVSLGLGTLASWLVARRDRLRSPDYLTVLAMVATTALAGFLAAVCVGILACCVDFAVTSARLSPVRRIVTRNEWPDKAERGAEQSEFLRREGGRLLIVELQGMLFFGSATSLSRRLEPARRSRGAVQCLVLDFRHVLGIDTSAARSLGRLLMHLRRAPTEVRLCGLSAPLRAVLEANAVLAGIAVYRDVESALAERDEALLARSEAAPGLLERALHDLLPETPPQRLLAHFESVSLASGQVLFERGDPSDALYLVESGRLEITTGANGGDVLLRTAHAGSAVGEMGLLRGTPRSASARAVGDVRLKRLGRERFESLIHDEPATYAALHQLLLLQMARRLDQSTLQAQAMTR